MRYRAKTVTLLSVLVMVVVGVTAAAANATISYEWKVKGAALKAGASKELKLQGKGLFHLNLYFFGGWFETTSSQLKLVGNTNKEILGGKPGTFKGALVFEKVVVTRPKLEGEEVCGVESVNREKGQIETNRLVGEIVESAEFGKGTGKTMLLLRSEGGEENSLMAFKIYQKKPECVDNGYELTPDGAVLAEISPQKTEATVGQLLFGTESAKNEREYRNAAGEFKKAVIKNFSRSALIGEPETELVSKELFGAF
jgi:hypothetical protein